MEDKEILDAVRNIDEDLIEASENYCNDERMIHMAMKNSSTIKAAGISFAALICAALMAVFVIKPFISGEKTPEGNADNSVTDISDGKTPEENVDSMTEAEKKAKIESEKIYNELTDEQRRLQCNTAVLVGYKKLTTEQYSALSEVKKDSRDESVFSGWMPYREMLAIGETKPIEKRMDIDLVKQMAANSDSLDELINMIKERQEYPDYEWVSNGVKTAAGYEQYSIMEYWFDDDGNSKLTINYYMIGYCSVTYIRDDIEMGRFNPHYYDFDESEKIYKELSEEQRRLQENTAKSVGYKRLTDEQYQALKKLREEKKENVLSWCPYEEMLIIGETEPIEERMTLEYVKEVIAGSKTGQEIFDKFSKKQKYCDGITSGSGRPFVIFTYYLNDNENGRIFIETEYGGIDRITYYNDKMKQEGKEPEILSFADHLKDMGEAEQYTYEVTGFRFITTEQINKLKKIHDSYEKDSPSTWMPYREMLVLEEVSPIKERMSLDFVKRVIRGSGSETEIMGKLKVQQKFCDVFKREENERVKVYYWLDDNGSKMVCIDSSDGVGIDSIKYMADGKEIETLYPVSEDKELSDRDKTKGGSVRVG